MRVREDVGWDRGKPAPVRTFAYADAFFTAPGPDEGAFAIRDERFKLIRWHDHQELYDLSRDPYETTDLLLDGASVDDRAAVERLDRIVARLRAE